MVQNNKRRPRHSDQEWVDIIKECRNSGMSDKSWCELHQIHPSKFYYHIRKLHSQACELPEVSYNLRKQPKQEVVQIQLNSVLPESKSDSSTVSSATNDSTIRPALRLNIGGCNVEIFNTADSETIYNTLATLQRLC